MVGFGEKKDEVIQVMDDLRSAEVDFINNWSILTTISKTSSIKSLLSSR